MNCRHLYKNLRVFESNVSLNGPKHVGDLVRYKYKYFDGMRMKPIIRVRATKSEMNPYSWYLRLDHSDSDKVVLELPVTVDIENKVVFQPDSLRTL